MPAATRSSPECAASDSTPRLWVLRPTTVFRLTSSSAASRLTRATLFFSRCSAWRASGSVAVFIRVQDDITEPSRMPGGRKVPMARKAEKPVVESLAVLAPPARVWEKIAPGAKPGRFTWRGTVLDVVPGSTLVLGSPVVTLTVKGQGGAALVTVVQGAAGPGEKLADYAHGWADFLLKLQNLLETERWEREVLARALVRATPAEVCRAWLSPKALAKLLPGKAMVQARVGGHFSWQHKIGKHVHRGTFLELQKNRRVSFTW